MVYAEYLLSFWLGFWYILGTECLHEQIPIKPWALSLLWASLTNNTSYMSKLTAVGIKCIQCNSPERGLLRACTWFPPVFTHASFLFADFCSVCFHCNKSKPWIQLHTESCEASSRITELGISLGDPWHRHDLAKAKSYIFALKYIPFGLLKSSLSPAIHFLLASIVFSY